MEPVTMATVGTVYTIDRSNLTKDANWLVRHPLLPLDLFSNEQVSQEQIESRVAHLKQLPLYILEEPYRVLAATIELGKSIAFDLQKNLYIKRKSNLPRSFLIDLDKKCTYVFLKSKGGFPVIGGHKKVTNVQAFPFDISLPPFSCIQWVNKDGKRPNSNVINRAAFSEIFQICRAEVTQTVTFPYHVPIFNVACYPKVKCNAEWVDSENDFTTSVRSSGTLNLQKISVIEEKYLSLASLPLTPSVCLSAALQLSNGLWYLHHEMKVLHGDLNRANAMWRETPDGGIEARLIDFGSMSFLERRLYHWALLSGYYGCPELTPPELYGDTSCTVDFLKVETWAFGCLLYYILFREELPWERRIRADFDKGIQPSEEDREKFASEVTTFIAVKNQSLKNPDPILQSLWKLTTQLICVNSRERLSTQAVLECIMWLNVKFLLIHPSK